MPACSGLREWCPQNSRAGSALIRMFPFVTPTPTPQGQLPVLSGTWKRCSWLPPALSYPRALGQAGGNAPGPSGLWWEGRAVTWHSLPKATGRSPAPPEPGLGTDATGRESEPQPGGGGAPSAPLATASLFLTGVTAGSTVLPTRQKEAPSSSSGSTSPGAWGEPPPPPRCVSSPVRGK